ncbi:efflux RND transporter periplasmic adaptor subunit [Psychrobacter sp. CAM01]|uniref:efflux RND transporter periplasmic adaptor subunit n=1 Tax=Psychrobacter sp. CAM01 TaxID=3080335 RepID=UPI0029357EB3|nr:HlyD family efflux transporter periplasmic adaptor subunit [Psychrobacter sp. CAM01]MDV2859891.1 efflux RND transporter periplasmic adaptor subunit [Psychrobacter sp. CAM01]
MTAFQWLKKGPYLLSVLLLLACQPSPPTDEPVTAENSETVDNPLIISDSTVTMTPDHILSIKPSRYQPSLGLQGNIQPIKQSQFVAAQPLYVEQVLVSEGQQVEKDAPLLIVRRLDMTNKTPPKRPDEINTETDGNAAPQAENAAPQTKSAAKDPATEKTSPRPDQTKQTPIEDAASEPSAIDSKSTSDSKANSDSNPASAKMPHQNNADADAATETPDDNASEHSSYQLITVRASFAGRVTQLNAAAGQQLAARTPLLHIADETKLYFVATVPIQAKPQLSVGQTVNFTTAELTEQFTGQVSKLVEAPHPKKLLVHVNVIDNESSRKKLLPKMQVTGRVNYGQIDVGTIVPRRALHDVNLTELHSPPYKPLRPLAANVWIIGQDQRLTRQPVEVIEFNPTTQQYLIAGISNDSLICLADLQLDSKGKKVIVS